MSDKKSQVVLEALKKFLQKGGDLAQLKTIAKQVSDQVTTQEKRDIVVITSAIELTQTQQDQVRSALEDQFKNGFRYEFATDSDLIAGLKIKINDYILDLSINGTINKVVDTLKQ